MSSPTLSGSTHKKGGGCVGYGMAEVRNAAHRPHVFQFSLGGERRNLNVTTTGSVKNDHVLQRTAS